MRYDRLPAWRTLKELSGFKDLTSPPKNLFVQGAWNPTLFSHCVAVVGSRRMSPFGRRAVEKVIPQLIVEKKTVVSGFMYGVDQYAHAQTVALGGKTIAVLGWGITRELTGSDRRLANAIIASGGLILSEWEHQRATRWTFPLRNRIVAALSEDVIVVEAGLMSGSIITANLALTLGRRLWAVPGKTHDPLSGTDTLIDAGMARVWPI